MGTEGRFRRGVSNKVGGVSNKVGGVSGFGGVLASSAFSKSLTGLIFEGEPSGVFKSAGLRSDLPVLSGDNQRAAAFLTAFLPYR